MAELWQNLKYSLRTLLKQPGFTCVAILTLALGIGANTAMFSVVNAVLLRALPYRDAGRLVIVWEDAASYGFPQDTPAPGNYLEWKTRTRSFEDIAAIANTAVNLTGDGVPEKIFGAKVTANLFSVLGVEPFLGRTFHPEEDQPGGNRAVLLSYGLWVRRFGSDAQVAGKQVRLDGANYTIAGVMPRGFQFPDREGEFWVPIAFKPDQLANKDSHFLEVVARLKPGVTLAQVNSDLAAIMRTLAEQFPNTNSKVGAYAVSLRDQFAGSLRVALLILLGAVAFVLLIACANVANLLLARATKRRREIALRLALGAGRGRVVRQLLTESLLVSFFGGALGLLSSIWVTSFLWRIVPAEFPPPEGANLDWRLLGFALFISVATGLVFGSAPSWRLNKLNLNDTLKEGGRGGASSAGARMRDVLVGAQVALAVVLLAGAGLLLESFAKLRAVDLGFRPEHVLTLRTSLPHPKYDDLAKRIAYFDDVLDRVGHLPGVIAVGNTSWVPLTNYGGANGITVEGRPPARPGEVLIPNTRIVSPGYFAAIGMTLKAGRGIEDRDAAQAPPVAVVNETAARRIWPGEDAVGKRFQIGYHNAQDVWITVVGVVGDVHQAGIDAPPRWEIYLPYRQQSHFQPDYFAVRTSGDPALMIEAIRQRIWTVDREQPVSSVRTMQARVDEELSPRRIQTSLLGGFAGLALVLASLGLYAVLSFAVAQRTQEIGVRMALGAQRRDVFRLVVSQGMRPTLVGMAVGIAGAYALHRVVAHLLFKVSPTDPLTFGAVATLLALVALAACYVPARRATRVDPMVALRYE